MRLSSEFVRLPLRFDPDALAEEVLAVPESDWQPHPQGFPGNSALPLVAAGGDPSDEATRGVMLPTPVLSRLPHLRAVLASFGAPIGRSRLMRLDGDAEATVHVDVNYYWLQRVRIHVPIVTQPGVRFLCGPAETFMAAGETWVFDTWRAHNVINPPDVRRIHLVVDTVGSAHFWDLVEQGESLSEVGELTPSQRPFERIDPQAGDSVRFERTNHPVVMSPWELRHLTGLLLEGMEGPADAQTRLRQLVEELCRDWAALWAVHGDDATGHERFKELAARIQAKAHPLKGLVHLKNTQDPVTLLRNAVLGVAVNPDLASTAAPIASAPVATAAPVRRQPQPAPPAPIAARAQPNTRRLVRPVFIVSAPRSGSTLLFETLAQGPDLWTIGDESHELIEGLSALHPEQHGWHSNRLTGVDATPEIVDRLEQRFLDRLRDRGGRRPPVDGSPLTMLEKTPKNSLRVPFLAEAFPDARFVYLYRDPVDTLNSMIEAWRSGRFVTYPDLPGWSDQKWSLLLVPGWRDLAGRPLAELVAEQWRRTVEIVMADLEALPSERWCVASYGRLVKEPQQEIERLCAFLDLRWDRKLTAPLPPSRFTLTRPEPGKWRRNEAELLAVLPIVADVAEQARAAFGQEPGPSRASEAAAPPPPRATTPPRTEATSPVVGAGFTSTHSTTFPELLASLRSSLLVSTYQSGRLIAFRADDNTLNTHFRAFESPMGIAVGAGRFALGTRRQIWEYRDQPAATERLTPPGKHDACFLPRRSHFTGDIRVHELAYAGDELWFISTLFSCLATLDSAHSFVPRWRPSFVSALAPEDRCHLNGFTTVDGRVRYVSALGETDNAEGWRDNKADGGIVIDVDSGEIVTRGLSMPHSPRWHDGALWILESGKGSLARIDLATGAVTTVASVPGFTRGLSFAGHYAFIGLSQTRESVFHGLPIMDRSERAAGVWVVDTRTGRTAAFLRFEGIVHEIFDVQLLPGKRFPEIAEPDSDIVSSSFVLPDAALADVPVGLRSVR